MITIKELTMSIEMFDRLVDCIKANEPELFEQLKNSLKPGLEKEVKRHGIIVATQHWRESYIDGWVGEGWYDENDNEIEGDYQELTVIDTDKHGHPTKVYIKIT